MAQFYPVQTITLIPAGVINPNRFVNLAGAQAGTGQAARGVTHDGAPLGEKAVPVITLGTAIVEAGAAFAAQALLTSDDQGRAIEAADASGNTLNAIAVEAATAAGDLVEVVIVSPIAEATMVRAAAQANSVAIDVAGIVADFNGLLAKLRTAGVIAQ
ncbi:hypothetical protein JCM15765_02540 [Paradesulfitobacterium aromaticivorans]